MDKTQLRKHFLKQRKALDLSQLEQFNQAITDHLLDFYTGSYNKLHSFLPIEDKNEFNTWPFIQHWQTKGGEVVIPDFLADNTPICYKIDEKTTFTTDKYGISIPKEKLAGNHEGIDLILVPLLCFDEQGNRVGYGKGIYDRILAQIPSKTKIIGVSFFEPIPNLIETNKFDQKLHACVTPNKVYEF